MRLSKRMFAALCAGLCCLACLYAPLFAGAAPSELIEVTDEALPDTSSGDLPEADYPGWIDYGMVGARFYLVEAAKDSVVYAAVSESPYDVGKEESSVSGYTPFIEVQAGDPLMMCYHPDYRGFGDDEWICVVLEPEMSYFRRGYVRAADLKKNEEGEIARKKLANHTATYNEFASAWSENGPVSIYASKEGGAVIGTLREGIVLPVVWGWDGQRTVAQVSTYAGDGYVDGEEVEIMEIFQDSGGEEIEEIPEGGDVGEGTEETTPEEGTIPEENLPEEGNVSEEDPVDIPQTGDVAPAVGLAVLIGVAACAVVLKKARG